MRYKSLKIKYSMLKSFFIILIFIIPYAETSILAFAFTDSAKTFYLRSILIFQMVLFLGLSFYHGKRIIKNKTSKVILLFALFIFINCIMSIVLEAKVGAALVTGLSILLPIANANYLLISIRKNNLNIDNIIKWAVNLYSIFVVYCIVFNIAKYGLELSHGSNRFRLSASAGGPVILGYTISLVLIFMFANKDIFTRKNVIINSAIFILGITYTMDRGAYVILILGLLYLLVTEQDKMLKLILFIGIIVAVVFMTDTVYERIFELFFGNRTMENLTETMRFKTAVECINEYIKNPFYYLFGQGVSNFFPFQKWTASGGGVNINLFSYYGTMLLVQPHNTVIYLLMETGIVGILFFLYFSFCGQKNLDGKYVFNVIIVDISFVLLGLFESTIIIQPGIACMWWLMVLLTKIRFNTIT